MQGQITSRDLLSAAGPSLHRPQSFPAPPAAHKHANRQIHYAVFVCVRACRLQAADSQTPSQPRPPALVPSQISQPPLPPPSSLRGSSNSVARRLPARRQRSSPELLFFFFLPRWPRTELRGAAMVQRGLSLSLRRAQRWYCSCKTSVCLKLVSAGSGQPA